MPLHVYWDDREQSILRCDSEGKWTWDEYHNSLNQVCDMARDIGHRVDLINVELPGASMPAGSPLPHFNRASKVLPDNVGLNIVVVRSAVVRAMASMMGKMPGNQMHTIKMVATIDEAMSAIAQDREKHVAM